MQTGYTIFVIRGKLPDPKKNTFEERMPREGQMYIPAKDIETFTKTNKDNTLNVRGQDIRELDAALDKSLKDGDGKKEEKKEEPKFKAFTGKGVTLSDERSTGVDTSSELYQILAAEYGDDPEMIQGIMMSMQASEEQNLEVPDEPATETDGAINIQMRMPDGSKLQRRFLKSNTIGDLMNFVKKNKSGLSSVKFMTTFPKRVLDDASLTLEAAKFSKSEALNVDAK